MSVGAQISDVKVPRSTARQLATLADYSICEFDHAVKGMYVCIHVYVVTPSLFKTSIEVDLASLSSDVRLGYKFTLYNRKNDVETVKVDLARVSSNFRLPGRDL